MAISQPKLNQNKLAQMPSKLRRAIGAVKDQTSISLAKVSITATSTVNLDVPVLKATSRDESPVDPRHVVEILRAVSTSRAHAAACAEAINRRVARTRSWVVALKSLTLVLGIFQGRDPHFPAEMRRVMKVLNFSNFKDDSNSKPWDCASFVRVFALYLDERLDCLLSDRLGRLHCRWEGSSDGSEAMRNMKPAMLIDRVSQWQKLLDRAVATRPAGEAAENRLVLSSLRAVVRESFDLYRDVSDGMAVLLDGFFRLPYQSGVAAFQACVRASRQFEDLAEFYLFCRAAGVGRTSEYPSVQRISGELVETLHDFLKDRAASPDLSDAGSDSATAAPEEWEPIDDGRGGVATTLESLLLEGPPSTVAPTFCAGNPFQITASFHRDNDPFDAALCDGEKRPLVGDETVVSCEQRLWLENQKKIIAKRVCDY